MDDEELMKRARKRVDMKMAFYMHLLVYVCVNLGLYAINQYRGGQSWHVFPLFGWGVGLAVHGIVTFLSLNGEGMRDRMLEAEIEKLKGRR
jgi:2TM domain